MVDVMDQISEAKNLKKETRSDARIQDGQPSAWIIVLTKRLQEKVVKLRLEQRGFEVYLPMRLVHGPKKGIYPVAFFPGMVFARATLDAERWQAIFTTPGIARVLCSPDRPIGVREEFMQLIRDQEIKGYLHLVPRDQAVAARVFPKGSRTKLIKSQADVLHMLQSEAIDERRASLLASFTGDSSMRVTVDFRKRAAGGGI